ncbi:MAG: ComEC/Rec2 family competence protein [Clostridia bacterium]|nr:ComEC/Rec2 family competence protein [Clostridia bacterium]
MIRYVLRPCWVMGLVWLITLLTCPWLSAGWRIALMAISGVVLMVSLCVPIVRHIHVVPLIAAVCLLATAVYHSVDFWLVQPTEVCIGQPVSLEVQVTENTSYALLKVQSGELPRGTQIVFYSPNAELALEKYDEFTAVFVLEPYDNGSTLSQLTRRASGVWLRVKTVDSVVIEETLTSGDIPWTEFFVRIRERLATDIEKRLDGDIGAATAGICYGVDERLSDEAVSNFRTCGVSHLFAVSGLHMTVLLQGLLYVLRRLRVGRIGRSVTGAVLLLIFMGVVGFSASVVRAGVVSLVVLFGECLRRRADARNSLGIALLILLVPDPFAAYDVGLLLSFTATYGLLCWTEPIGRFLLRDSEPKRFARVRKTIAATVAVSMAATLATLPVLVIYFGRMPILSVAVNLLTTLPAEVVLITGCLSSLFSVVGLSALARPLLMLAGLMSRYLLWICEKFSAFSFATVATSAGFLVLWLIGMYVLFLIGYRVLGKQGAVALCGIGVCFLCVGWLLSRGTVYNTLRAGTVSDDDDLAVVLSYRGSAVAVTAPNSVTALYGMGDMLDTFGVSHLDALFIIGGGEPAVSYIPSVLEEYLTDGTQVCYSNLPWKPPLDGTSLDGCRVRLGEFLTAQRQQDQLVIHWYGQTLLFTAESELVGTADAVFGTGDIRIWLRTESGVQPLEADRRFVVFKNGKWYTEG